jgi:hypothetical protein
MDTKIKAVVEIEIYPVFFERIKKQLVNKNRVDYGMGDEYIKITSIK